jgi:hypothetical protein
MRLNLEKVPVSFISPADVRTGERTETGTPTYTGTTVYVAYTTVPSTIYVSTYMIPLLTLHQTYSMA